MFNADSYMTCLTALLLEAFGDRLIYVGLQGSYLRGEATDASDIDPMVVIDQLTVSDLNAYRTIVESLEMPEKSCGFLCGKDELNHWSPLEIGQLIHGTKDYHGHLTDHIPACTRADAINFARLSVGNLYHEILHRYLHASPEKNRLRLPGAYKQVFFILQSLHWLESSDFISTRQALLPLLRDNDRCLLQTPADADFDSAFDQLLRWCQRTLTRLNDI